MTILDWSKFKATVNADDKLNLPENVKYVLRRVEKHYGEKGENAGYQHFLFFLQRFQRAHILGLLKLGIVWERVKSYWMWFQWQIYMIEQRRL